MGLLDKAGDLLKGAGKLSKKFAQREAEKFKTTRAKNVVNQVKGKKDAEDAEAVVKKAKRYAARNAAIGTVAATYAAPKAVSFAQQFEIKKKPTTSNAKKVAANAAKVAANKKKVAANKAKYKKK